MNLHTMTDHKTIDLITKAYDTNDEVMDTSPSTNDTIAFVRLDLTELLDLAEIALLHTLKSAPKSIFTSPTPTIKDPIALAKWIRSRTEDQCINPDDPYLSYAPKHLWAVPTYQGSRTKYTLVGDLDITLTDVTP